MVAADPERHRRRRVVDEHAADVGVLRQQILAHTAPVFGSSRETRSLIIEPVQASPFLSSDDVIGLRPRRRQHPLLDLLGLGIEHADGVAGVFGEPQPVLLIDRAAARPRVGDVAADRR